MTRPRLGPELAKAAALMQQGRAGEAETICRHVLKRDKKDVDAYQILGLVESMVGRFDRAIATFQRGLKMSPRTPMLLCGLAKACTSLGRYDEALAAYDKALAVDPRYTVAIAGKADALEHVGDFAEARVLLDPIVAGGDEDAETAFIYATLLQREKRDDEATAICEKHLAVPNLANITRSKLLYGVGKSYDRLKRYDEAFEAFRQANEIHKRPFSIQTVRSKFNRARRVFSPESLPKLSRASTDSELPIFVVSMPRSGSTLVEQILASHPRVFGAGETEEMIHRLGEMPKEVGGGLDYPEAVTVMDRRTADRLSARYLGRIRSFDRAAERIVDKNLQNFQLLGLISLLVPRARVIYCRRDPLSVCFSCFMLPLSPVALPYTTDLRNLGLFHREYERLMDYWMETLDLAILPVQYEELVADQERVSRRIIDFAGLDWDDACLRFHETDREVSTASYDQVRQPIYKAALKRYEPYEAHLEPLRRGLALEEEGPDDRPWQR